MQLENTIYGILERAKNEIQSNFASKGINASGNTAKSIRVERFGSVIRLVGGTNETRTINTYGGGTMVVPKTALFDTIEKGVAPTTLPKSFASVIFDWSQNKGLSFSSERERWGFSFATWHNIQKKGTRRYRNNEDVYSSVVAKSVEDIRKAIGDFAKNIRLTSINN